MSEKKSSNRIIKIIGWVIPILIVILARNYFNNIEAENAEFFRKGGAEALSFRIGEYDSLMLAGLKIKYPTDYIIQQKQGNEILGEYTLLKRSSQSQLIIGFEPKKNAQGILYNSINDVLNYNKNAYENFIQKEYKVTPSSSQIKIKERKGKQIKYIEIQFGDNEVYLYAIQTKSHIFRFSSDKNHFLENLIDGIEAYKDTTQVVSKLNKSNSTVIKTVNKLKIPLYDWEIVQDLDIKEIKTHQIILGNDEDAIGIMSTTNDYITDLREYSDYYNEKTVRNMKPSGLILTSKGIKNGKFQDVNSVTELFSVYHEPTGKKYEMEAVTIKIGDYFYNISYATNEKSKKVINNIEISNF